MLKAIRSYSSRLEADLARLALEAEDIPATVVGVGLGFEGGTQGVQLLVPEECVEIALKVLEDD